MRITAPGVVFGGPGKGFTLRGSQEGIEVRAADVIVQGNRIVGSGQGIAAGPEATSVSIVDNVVTDTTDYGVIVLGDDAVVMRNVVESNQRIGMYVEAVGAVIADNHIVNNVTGLHLFAQGTTTIRHNVLTGNIDTAVSISWSGTAPAGVVVTSNNFADNGELDGSHCGIRASGFVVNAERNYWGGAQGPGAGAADHLCGTIDAVPFLTRPVVISSQTGR